ncbi:carbohydrate ABC transporter permease [Natronospirillum operosum]|uniref:carbohydrate ABC transporter permease n=1 Tax=Natronospirillum operosum TaxID=2759953 RepID=UPI00197BD636|nr:carbohydrate ABC transporter permease [Natronospirillum operosum]
MALLMHSLRWLVFLLAAFILNFPIISTVVTSLKSRAEVNANAGLSIQQPTLDNFIQVLTVTDRLNIYGYLQNSLVAAMIGTILPIIICFPIAYAIARRNYGSNILFPLVINLRALPLIIFSIPLYLMYQFMGLLDTRLGLGLILAVINLPLTLLILVNGIHDVPEELDEAAKIEGASLWIILSRVVLPVCRPAVVVTFIFGFITAWNEFLFGLMLTTRDAVPMTVGASFFFSSGGGGIQWGMAAAIIIIAALPPTLLGLVMYRQISRSMLGGAVKG